MDLGLGLSSVRLPALGSKVSWFEFLFWCWRSRFMIQLLGNWVSMVTGSRDNTL